VSTGIHAKMTQLSLSARVPHVESTVVARSRQQILPETTELQLVERLREQSPTPDTFSGPSPGTTQVSRYQKGKTDPDFTEARDSEWQWHQLGHMQVCASFQTDNHASIPQLSFYMPDALPAVQPTASKL